MIYGSVEVERFNIIDNYPIITKDENRLQGIILSILI